MMDLEEATGFVRQLYKDVLRREPKSDELARWADLAATKLSPAAVVGAFFRSPEGRRHHDIKCAYPNGHWHSPIVDPSTVTAYVGWQQNLSPRDLPGVEIDPDAMRVFWEESADVIRSTPFTEMPVPERRFHYEGGFYPNGDAIVLRAMMAKHRPRRVVEIGSGFSTACMLDCADEFGLDGFEMICIDPDARRLRGMLRPEDEGRVTIIEQPVQEVSLDTFTALEAGDFLFIDSTHVLKTGSDVHYELFYILPALRDGVIVHVHDVPYPFEYCSDWIFAKNFSWNEAYALRAFLMYNAKFSVYFWGNLVSASFPELVQATVPAGVKIIQSAVWLKKQTPGEP